MIYNKEFIKEKILSNDLWFKRAVVAIYKNQTEDEKFSESTKIHNGVGFSGVDAQFLSSLAKTIQASKPLSPKQIIVGKRKIIKYCKQLTMLANEKNNLPQRH